MTEAGNAGQSIKIGVVIPQPAVELLFTPADRQRLESLGQVRWHQGDARPDTSQAIALLRDCQVGIGSWGTPWPDPELVAACPSLRLWVHAAGSVRRMLGEHLEGRDLAIVSCAPSIAENVAEYTLGWLIIGLRRAIPDMQANRQWRGGPVTKPDHRMNLHEATVGVVGASQVGRRVIRNIRPHAQRTLVYDPFLSDADAAALGATRCEDLTELCAQSDAVTLHVPDLPATRHMIGATQLRRMKDHAVFINTARGSCVDEPALIEELSKGRLMAFLDVSDPEPAAPDSPLRSLPNVVLTTHIAGGASSKIGRQAVDDIDRFLRGEPLDTAVTRQMLDRIA